MTSQKAARQIPRDLEFGDKLAETPSSKRVYLPSHDLRNAAPALSSCLLPPFSSILNIVEKCGPACTS
jgi:hypothetical protein